MSRPSPPMVRAVYQDGLAERDLYAVLQVAAAAGAAEIRAAYRRAALAAHPDKGGTPQTFHDVTSAFDVLSCPIARALYDRDRQRWLAKEEQERQKKGVSRKRSSKASESSNSRGAQPRLAGSLCKLHTVLQSMDKTRRNESISNLSSSLQKSLIAYMEERRHEPAEAGDMTDTTGEEQAEEADVCQGKAKSSSVRLRAVRSGAGTKYSAQLDLDSLRSYTRQNPLEAAVEAQLVLAQVRDRLVAAEEENPSLWQEPDEFCEIFHTVLREHSTNAETFGLSVFVQMRASQWVANSHCITSPVVSLAEAVALRARLVSARQSSWKELRQEWLQLLQQGKKSLSLADAETFVDKARSEFLERRLLQAIGSAEKAQQELLDKPEKAEEVKVPKVAHLNAQILKVHTQNAETWHQGKRHNEGLPEMLRDP
mmetsp:Transcript_96912/g.172502  ORF Transcript_96912/g.172502 Transcript_96912/m.172502 type:complete len:426 (+) Transcript_96912:152-1429(+)